VSWYEVANGLTMASHSNRRAGRNEFGNSRAKFPNAYFGSFHLFFLYSPSDFVDQSVRNIQLRRRATSHWGVPIRAAIRSRASSKSGAIPYKNMAFYMA
jgi:hypothetical protein